jgi:hypothetical protein
LTKKYNAINTEDLSRLQKFLPDNVDNIRLVLEIEKIASPYGMSLKDVKYDATVVPEKKAAVPSTTKTTEGEAAPVLNGAAAAEKAKEYGEWVLQFSTEGTYGNFINFTKDLESNLRIVDVSSITFSSDGAVVLGKQKPSDTYKYEFKIKTYWLKN